MAKVKIVLNRRGVGQLLKSEEMQSFLQSKAEEISGRCGEGYSADVYVGKNRANAMVKTETDKAYFENMNKNTILKNTY
ncbi:MAG: hypothetical protein ACOYJH_02975 [Anaerovoracaceae bacterium]|jgi:hypothetical protein